MADSCKCSNSMGENATIIRANIGSHTLFSFKKAAISQKRRLHLFARIIVQKPPTEFKHLQLLIDVSWKGLQADASSGWVHRKGAAVLEGAEHRIGRDNPSRMLADAESGG